MSKPVFSMRMTFIDNDLIKSGFYQIFDFREGSVTPTKCTDIFLTRFTRIRLHLNIELENVFELHRAASFHIQITLGK